MAGSTEGGKQWIAPTMNGGNDINSYTKNSSFQRKVGDSVKSLVDLAITEKLDMTTFSRESCTFRIADLGCSVGPNTFFNVENVVKAVETKVNENHSKIKFVEFQVFFNDQASNDFNTLFTSLPENGSRRSYYAVGVPGSFYGRLFPSSSLHFVYSSCAMQYLSRVPEEVLDKNGTAWNKGKIHYSNSNLEVALAYSNQHAQDMDKFWEARAQEIVLGGLMVIILPARSNGTPHSKCHLNKIFDALGSCLHNMVTKGVIDEEKLDLFNLPIYFSSPHEIEEGINRNGYFSIERIESFSRPGQGVLEDNLIGSESMTMHIRAALEGLIKQHFGQKILDELFNIFKIKLQEEYSHIMSSEAINLFILLRRKSIV